MFHELRPNLKAVFCLPAACIPLWSASLKGCILAVVVQYAWSGREDSYLACQGVFLRICVLGHHW